MTIILFEDNGGGLHLTDGIDIYHYPDDVSQSPIQDILTFSEWKGDASPAIEPIPEDGIGQATMIATAEPGKQIMLYVRDMGAAGKHFFGLNKE